VIGLNEGYREVLESIASDSPTPGGGSVAALSLAHAHALVCMVARLTLKSSKWESGHDAAAKALDSSQEGITAALNLAHKDAESFDSVMLAFRMPKSTDDEIKHRRAAIAQGYLRATQVPMETAESGLELLRSLTSFATNCNANAITDLAAAAQLARSSVTIAALNVRINLASLGSEEAEHMSNSIENLVSDGARLANQIGQIVAGRM
tara:strand:+ start:890 stop:1513 length:624 start_codon:yes stop_codon:yes gene_type:complete